VITATAAKQGWPVAHHAPGLSLLVGFQNLPVPVPAGLLLSGNAPCAAAIAGLSN
jgi:hypothetical protein